MLSIRCLVLVGIMTFTPQITSADEPAATRPAEIYRQFAGAWETSPEINRLLGFENEESRLDAQVMHPQSFRLSIDEKSGESIKQEVMTIFQEAIFQKMGHEIIATGKWETTFEIVPASTPNVSSRITTAPLTSGPARLTWLCMEEKSPISGAPNRNWTSSSSTST